MADTTGDLVTRVYSGFRGVDFRGEEINIIRSPDSLNVWKDYKETESIRTRPGMELQLSFADPVYGEWYGYLRRDGKPTEPSTKGSTFKGPFHLPRMLSMVDVMIGEILGE